MRGSTPCAAAHRCVTAYESQTQTLTREKERELEREREKMFEEREHPACRACRCMSDASPGPKP
jgi:hypothetical protein